MLIRALLSTCLNLAVADAIKSVQWVSDWIRFDTVRKKVIAKKHKVRQNKSRGKKKSRGVHTFCLTRWTLRGEALAVV